MAALDAAVGPDRTLAVIQPLCLAGACMVVAATFAGVPQLPSFGPLSAHMLQHVLMMNGAGLLAGWVMAAWLTQRQCVSNRAATALLVAGTIGQTILLWGWHAPPVFAQATASAPLMAAMHVSLFAAALVFWTAVFLFRGAERWRPILALLIAGKLFCLLGALFVFSGRPLFGDAAHNHAGHMAHGMTALEDQHLAGLIMVVACPLTYVAAGVIIAGLWLRDLERNASGTPAWLRGIRS